MKIDFKLIRQILLSFEDENLEDKLVNDSFELSEKKYYSNSKTFDKEDIIAYHISYLQDSGLVIDINAAANSSGKFQLLLGARPRLSATGHDFLNSIRNDTIFNKIIDRISESGVSATMDIVKDLGVSIAKQMLKLN